MRSCEFCIYLCQCIHLVLPVHEGALKETVHFKRRLKDRLVSRCLVWFIFTCIKCSEKILSWFYLSKGVVCMCFYSFITNYIVEETVHPKIIICRFFKNNKAAFRPPATVSPVTRYKVIRRRS